jgi:hypothetical protein
LPNNNETNRINNVKTSAGDHHHSIFTSVSAMLVVVLPTAYATTTVLNSTRSSADIVNNETRLLSEGDIKNLVAGGAMQLNVHIVQSTGTAIQPGGFSGSATVDCPSGQILTGGGFGAEPDIRVFDNEPMDENTWVVQGVNESPNSQEGLTAYALCLEVGP